MNFANLERTEKTRKQWHGCHVLLIFVKTLFTFGDWYPSRFSYHGILIRSLVNHASRAWCPAPRHADNLGSITRHTANFGAITRHANTFFHPLNSALWPDSIAPNVFFFRMKQIAYCTGIWDRKNNGNPLKRWQILTRKKSLSTSFKRALFELS